MASSNMPATPMLDKQSEAIEEGHSFEIGAFLDWMTEQGIHRMRWGRSTEDRACPSLFCADGWVVKAKHPEGRPHPKDERLRTCGTCDGTGYVVREVEGWLPDTRTIQRLLADYFEIDLVVVETEQRLILDALRTQHEAAR